MALNFPNNPNNGDVFTSDTKSWIYNSSKGIWISSTTGIGVIDDDTMLTASSDKLSTSESIKQYVDEHTHDEHILVINDDNSGYEISPRGLITQWGEYTNASIAHGEDFNVVFSIAFPNALLQVHGQPNDNSTSVISQANANNQRIITTSKTGFTAEVGNFSGSVMNMTYKWQAIGY